MPSVLGTFTRNIDFTLIGAIFLIVAAGLLTMNSFTGENYFFECHVLLLIGGF